MTEEMECLECEVGHLRQVVTVIVDCPVGHGLNKTALRSAKVKVLGVEWESGVMYCPSCGWRASYKGLVASGRMKDDPATENH